MTPLSAPLVGMSFYRHAKKLVALFTGETATSKAETVLLVREPDNEHDPNAIAVYYKIGHIDRNNAAIWAAFMDPDDAAESHRLSRLAVAGIIELQPDGTVEIVVNKEDLE